MDSCFCGYFSYLEIEDEKLGGKKKAKQKCLEKQGRLLERPVLRSPYLKWATKNIKTREQYEW